MSIFPFITYEEEHKLNEPLPLYREVAWDFVTNDIKLRNGSPLIVEGNEAIKVWCYKALKTERFLYSIYSWEFGTELYELTGKPYSKALIESEAIRYIKEALLVNEYILDVNVSNVGFDGSKLTATAIVTTVYGEVDVVV